MTDMIKKTGARIAMATAVFVVAAMLAAAAVSTAQAEEVWPKNDPSFVPWVNNGVYCKIVSGKNSYPEATFGLADAATTKDPATGDAKVVQFKISDVKCTNTKALKVKDNTSSGHHVLEFYPTGKAGSGSVSFKVTNTETGASKDFKYIDFKFIKYACPFKTFKIADFDLIKHKAVNKSPFCSLNTKAKKIKVNVKAKSGFKVKEISIFNPKNRTSKTIKNGKSYKIAKGSTINVTYVHKASKATDSVQVTIQGK